MVLLICIHEILQFTMKNVMKENSVMIEMERQEQRVCEHDDRHYVHRKENESVQRVNQLPVHLHVEYLIVGTDGSILHMNWKSVMMEILFLGIDVHTPVCLSHVVMVLFNLYLENNVMTRIQITSMHVPTPVCYVDVEIDG